MADDRYDWHPVAQRQFDETLVAAEIDFVAVGPRPKDLVCPSRIHEYRRSGVERESGVLHVRRHFAETAHELLHARDAEGGVEGETDQGIVDAALAVPGRDEGRGVRREYAARMVADQEHRSVLGDVFESAYFGVEVAVEPFHERQKCCEEIRVSLKRGIAQAFLCFLRP